nr:MAG TPA: hypothetical protein [Caudoviricetes sp.]
MKIFYLTNNRFLDFYFRYLLDVYIFATCICERM